MPITDQSSRTLVNRWAVSLDKRGEALPALKETEYSEMLILAAKTPGLLEAIEYAETKCVTNLPLAARISATVCKGISPAITLQFPTMTTCVKVCARSGLETPPARLCVRSARESCSPYSKALPRITQSLACWHRGMQLENSKPFSAATLESSTWWRKGD